MKKKPNGNDEFAAKKRAIEHTLAGSNRTFRKIDVFEAVTSCPFCGKRYAQFSGHIWQPDCHCINDSITLCVVKLEREWVGGNAAVKSA
jgi:hypothetical protein